MPVAGVQSATSSSPVPLVVQAAGAVNQPGVYRLEVGARVDDLLRAAGGAGPEADLDRVNLAAPSPMENVCGFPGGESQRSRRW